MFRRTRWYHLVGSHGKTPGSAVGCTKSSNKSVSRSGVLEASPGTEKAPKFEASDAFLLAQSKIKFFVALENNVIIQGRF